MSGRGGRGGFGRGFIRFQSASGSSGGAAIPPPPSLQVSRNPINTTNNKGFASLSTIHKTVVDPISSLKLRHKTEDAYFDDDEEQDTPLYQPGPNSPGAKGGEESDEDDPLEAFMSGIEKEVKRQEEAPKLPKPTLVKGVRDDIEDLDDEESKVKSVSVQSIIIKIASIIVLILLLNRLLQIYGWKP